MYDGNGARTKEEFCHPDSLALANPLGTVNCSWSWSEIGRQRWSKEKERSVSGRENERGDWE